MSRMSENQKISRTNSCSNKINSQAQADYESDGRENHMTAVHDGGRMGIKDGGKFTERDCRFETSGHGTGPTNSTVGAVHSKHQ
jgi:hypothetical protein